MHQCIDVNEEGGFKCWNIKSRAAYTNTSYSSRLIAGPTPLSMHHRHHLLDTGSQSICIFLASDFDLLFYFPIKSSYSLTSTTLFSLQSYSSNLRPIYFASSHTISTPAKNLASLMYFICSNDVGSPRYLFESRTPETSHLKRACSLFESLPVTDTFVRVDTCMLVMYS